MKKIRTASMLLAAALIALLCTGCGNQAAGEPTQTPDSTPVVTPEQPETQSPEPTPEVTPSEQPSEEPEDTRIVKEDYVFEGPGIVALKDYPAAYKEEATQRGSVEKLTYDNGEEEKYLHVYLPYGYKDSDKSYNVFFMMHGGNGRPEIYLQLDRSTALQKVIDNMIQNGDVEPFILVAPTWNCAALGKTAPTDSGPLTQRFAEKELAQYVIPLIDATYRTNATREGRAFGGFSMGGVTTWYTFLYDLEHIKYFVPMSGDCWLLGQYASAEQSAATVAAMADAVSEQGYTGSDFTIYCYTGTQDYALPNLAPQIYAMQKHEMFTFGENTFFGTYPEAIHADTWARTYLYNTLPLLWQE